MIRVNLKLTTFVILLLLIYPGCLARYGKGRLNQLLTSVNDLQRECKKNNEELSEERIKERLGKPGLLKPVYERNLDISLLQKLRDDSDVLLKPHPHDLYDNIWMDNINGKLKSVKLLSYIYDRTGLEDPSLTFYIGTYSDEKKDKSKIIGWDYVKYVDYDPVEKRRKLFVNYEIKKPVDYLRLPYTFLIDAIIGLKQFVGEVIKSPISFIETEFFENIFVENKIPFYKFDGFKAAFEDCRNGVAALTYRYRVDGKQGILATTQNLLGEIPIAGSLLDQWYKKESGTADRLFLSRGINGGDNSAQNTALWAHFFTDSSGKFAQYQVENHPLSPPLQGGDKGMVLKQERQSQADVKESVSLHIKTIPYRYGSVSDVMWSLLNISHGFAYDMASEIVLNNNVNPGDSILLSGHSGGVQRIISTARILNDDGISVAKMYGITGPALGYAPCNKIEAVLNGKLFQDPTSDVSRLLNYITFYSLTNIKWKYDKREDETKNKDEVYKHRTPGFYDGKTRLKYDGFLEENLKEFFR